MLQFPSQAPNGLPKINVTEVCATYCKTIQASEVHSGAYEVLYLTDLTLCIPPKAKTSGF
jgi:hypothetical protein